MEHQPERALIPLSFINFLTSAIEWVEMEPQPERALILYVYWINTHQSLVSRNGALARKGIDTPILTMVTN